MLSFIGTLFCQTYSRREGLSYDIADKDANFMFFYPAPDSEVAEQLKQLYLSKCNLALEIEYQIVDGFKVPTKVTTL